MGLVLGWMGDLSAKSSISWARGDYSLQTVTGDNFTGWEPLSEDLYEGLENGVYWLKIRRGPSAVGEMLTLPNYHLTSARMFSVAGEILQEPNTRYLNFVLPAIDSTENYFLRINCKQEGNIPLEFRPLEAFWELHSNQSLVIGLYNGIVIAVILFNLLLFTGNGEKNHLYYSAALFFISLAIFNRDGSLQMFLGNNSYSETLEVINNIFIAVSCMVLSHHYMQIESHFPRLKYWAFAISIAALCFIVSFLITNELLLSIISDMIFWSGLLLYWVVAIALFRKSVYARFIVLAYGPMVILSFDHYLFPRLGIHSLEVPLNLYRFGGLADVVVFIYAITYQSRKMNKENRLMAMKLRDYGQQSQSERNGENVFAEFETRYGLSKQELKVLERIVEGKMYQEIADELFVSLNTVKFHIRNLYAKMDIHSKKEARDLVQNAE